MLIVCVFVLISCEIRQEKPNNKVIKYPCYTKKGNQDYYKKLCYYKGWKVFGKYVRHGGNWSGAFGLILKNPKTSETVHFYPKKEEWKLYKVGDTI